MLSTHSGACDADLDTAALSTPIELYLRLPALLDEEEEEACGEDPRDDIDLRERAEPGLEKPF